MQFRLLFPLLLSQPQEHFHISLNCKLYYPHIHSLVESNSQEYQSLVYNKIYKPYHCLVDTRSLSIAHQTHLNVQLFLCVPCLKNSAYTFCVQASLIFPGFAGLEISAVCRHMFSTTCCASNNLRFQRQKFY